MDYHYGQLQFKEIFSKLIAQVLSRNRFLSFLRVISSSKILKPGNKFCRRKALMLKGASIKPLYACTYVNDNLWSQSEDITSNSPTLPLKNSCLAFVLNVAVSTPTQFHHYSKTSAFVNHDPTTEPGLGKYMQTNDLGQLTTYTPNT